jgi:hypothetical protein
MNGMLIYIRGRWVEYKIPLHGNKKSWSGLNDIDVVKWIKRHVQCVNNLLKCYVRLSVMQAEQSTV